MFEYFDQLEAICQVFEIYKTRKMAIFVRMGLSESGHRCKNEFPGHHQSRQVHQSGRVHQSVMSGYLGS